MNKITEKFSHSVKRPIRVMQFGEGNFLRAFADYFIDILNEKTDFNGGIAIVKPVIWIILKRRIIFTRLYFAAERTEWL